jgi:muramoyltetrapeptide carboxypeptidase
MVLRVPNPLIRKKGKLRIISPSGAVQPEYIDGARSALSAWGYDVSVGKYAKAVSGRFAGTEAQRIYDLQQALDAKSVDIILCSRGGYGLSQIIDKIDFSKFKESPKWIVGFSDITVLHNAISKLGGMSIHGLMAKHLTEWPDENLSATRLREIFDGIYPVYRLHTHSLNRFGVAQGRLIGGNLSVLMAMRDTPFDLDYKGAVLFIEDIAEQPYHIDRMMQNLRLGGELHQLAGLIVGHFTDCPEDESMGKSVKEIILEATDGTNYPICFDFPAGHEAQNYPLVLGRTVKLDINEHETFVDFS